MRNSPIQVLSGPSYLIHPQNRRVEYGGGFRIIKPEVFQQTGPSYVFNGNDKTSIVNNIPNIQQIKSPNIFNQNIQINKNNQPTSTRHGYDYYHGNQDFTNFFGLEGDKYHICFNHQANCHICHSCQPSLNLAPNNCDLCRNKNTSYQNNKTLSKISKPRIQDQKRPSSHYSKRQSEQIINFNNQKQQRPKSKVQLVQSSKTTPKPQQQQHKQQNSIYEYIEEPLPPKNPTVRQQIQYQQKYKQYLLRKRDLYYLTILKKLIDKIDFERYQCTSPNQERIHAHWFGMYKPRIMQTVAGVVKYELDYHPGYQFLKSFVFIYVHQGKHKQKQNYEINSQIFLNQLQDLLLETEKSQPIKALQKLNADAYKRILEGKINKQKLRLFLTRLNFILMALNVNNFNQKLNKLPLQLTLEQYKRIFTMKIPPSKVQKINMRQFQTKSHNKSISQQKILYKPIFPEIQALEHTSHIIQSQVIQPKKLSIRQKRLLADLVQKQMEQRAHLNFKFKAKEIPKDVRDKQLYNRLLDQQAQKSAKNRQQSVKVLLGNENPFSFYYRDMNKQKPTQQFKQYQSFKAKQVPQHVNQPRYSKLLQQRQQLKKINLEKRQSQLLSNSKYPATMGYLQDYHHASKLKKQQKLPYSFQPNISSGQIPNFKDLHQKNIIQLQQRKQLNKTITTPQQFNLSKGNKKKQTEKQMRPSTTQKKRSKISQKQYLSGSTLKFDALVKQRRKENELKELKQKQKQKQLQAKPTKHQQFLKQRVQEIIKQIPIASQGNFVLPTSKWNQQDKQQMLNKVYSQQPLLIDRKYVRIDGSKVQVHDIKK